MKTISAIILSSLAFSVCAEAVEQLSNLTNSRTSSAFSNYFSNFLIQPFTTGSDPFELNTVTLQLNGSNAEVQATLWTSTAGPDFFGSTVTVGSTWSDITFSFGGLLLAPNYTYYMSVESIGVNWGGTTDNSFTALDGWVLPPASGKNVSFGVNNVGYNFMMKVDGVARPVPEPSAGLMLVSAGSMLGLLRRRRR